MSKVSIITAGEAAALVGDSMTVTTSGPRRCRKPWNRDFWKQAPRET